jgi:hypothetical protein
MSPIEEIDLWSREQIAIHGEPATEDDYGRFVRPKPPRDFWGRVSPHR